MPKRTSEISRTKEREREKERDVKIYNVTIYTACLFCFFFFLGRHLYRVDSLLESEIIRGERHMERLEMFIILYMWRKATSH